MLLSSTYTANESHHPDIDTQLNALSSQKQSDNFDEILQERVQLVEYLMDKYHSKQKPQLYFKKFVRLFSIPKILLKIYIDPDEILRGTPKYMY